MSRIKYDMELMKYLSLFDSVARVKAKDVLVDKNNTLLFIVSPGDAGRAIGKQASNIKRLSTMFNRRVRVVEYADTVERFIRNLVSPLRVLEIENNDGVVTIKGPDIKTKGLLIGRNLQNVHETESIVKRFFDIQSIKIL